MKVFGDKEMLANRWRANHDSILGAYLNDELAGSNVVSRWGTFGWFGPLTIRPDLWDRGIAKKLLEPTIELFSHWGVTHMGLFTFPNSPKHLGLYEKFGFNARFLTPVLKKKVAIRPAATRRMSMNTFSKLTTSKEKTSILNELRELTSRIYPGLDLTDEIVAVDSFKLGDTVLVGDESREVGFAICHAGANTEGGSGNCYVKFGVVLPGPSAKARFRSLLTALEGFASRRGLDTIEAGVNMGRIKAYQEMTGSGFRTEFTGVAMQKPNTAGFNDQEVFAIDDWR